MHPRLSYPTIAPHVLQATLTMSKTAQESDLEPDLVELVNLRASQINGCAFCIDMHTREARKRGEVEERIYALNAWQESPLFSTEERAALGLTEAVTLLSETGVPNGVWVEAEGGSVRGTWRTSSWARWR